MKYLAKKDNKLYRIIPIILILSMLISSIPASALSLNTVNLTRIELDSGEIVTLTKQELNEIVTITAQEAEEIAKLFVIDMSAGDNVSWNEQTEVVNVVPMYDNTDTNTVNAYTVNFTEGYVVVSAFLDTETQIHEWSDKAEALCSELDADADDKIIYLGGYEYYVDKGENEVTGLYDRQVQKSTLVNQIENTRDVANIPEKALVSRQNNGGISTASREVTDPKKDANDYYEGTFEINPSKSHDAWGAYIPNYTYSYLLGRGYKDCCAPVALTNSLFAYRIRYPNSALYVEENCNSIAIKTAEYGISKHYYHKYACASCPAKGGESANTGTTRELLKDYTKGIYNYYTLTPTVKNITISSFNTIFSELTQNNLILASIGVDDVYDHHTLLYHGISQYVAKEDGDIISYVHFADGRVGATRYAALAWHLGFDAVVIDF